MKNFRKFIKNRPSIPAPPMRPSRPQSSKSAGVPSIPGGGIPGFIKDKISSISGGKVSGVKGQISMSSSKVKELISEFPLDRYRDENGKLRCPISKEDRARLLSIFEE